MKWIVLLKNLEKMCAMYFKGLNLAKFFWFVQSDFHASLYGEYSRFLTADFIWVLHQTFMSSPVGMFSLRHCY